MREASGLYATNAQLDHVTTPTVTLEQYRATPLVSVTELAPY